MKLILNTYAREANTKYNLVTKIYLVSNLLIECEMDFYLVTETHSVAI